MQIGTTVQLRSGGPIMTIAKITDGKAWCLWFDGPDRKDANFVLETLVEARV